MWTIFWVTLAVTILLLEIIAIYLSFLTQYRQAEPAEKNWKSLYYIHNPEMKDVDRTHDR